MESGNFMLVWSILIPAVAIIYGFRLWQSPPKYMDSKGLNTPYTKKNKEAWKEGNTYFGKVLIIFGAIIGVISILENTVVPKNAPAWVYLLFTLIELGVIALIIPVVNMHVRKKFGFPKEKKK